MAVGKKGEPPRGVKKASSGDAICEPEEEVRDIASEKVGRSLMGPRRAGPASADDDDEVAIVDGAAVVVLEVDASALTSSSIACAARGRCGLLGNPVTKATFS